MKRNLIAGAATVLALSLGVAACGSSDDSSDSGSEDTLTKTELISQADALCTRFDKKLQTKSQDAFGNEQPSQEEVVAFISDEIVPMYRDQIDQLRELQPGEADSDAYANIVDTLESELDDVESDPEKAAGSESPFEGATAAAQDFGLKVCGAN